MLLTIVLASLLALQPGPRADSLVVTLLGTGTPNPRADRMGPAVLVEAGGKRLLFDAGRGVPIRLEQAGVRTGTVQVVFLTHLHSDHVTGLPDLWLTGWLPPIGGRQTPLLVIGPKGTKGMVDGLTRAFAEDVRIRRAGQDVTVEDVLAETQRLYSGRLEAGRDLMRITVGDSIRVTTITPGR